MRLVDYAPATQSMYTIELTHKELHELQLALEAAATTDHYGVQRIVWGELRRDFLEIMNR